MSDDTGAGAGVQLPLRPFRSCLQRASVSLTCSCWL